MKYLVYYLLAVNLTAFVFMGIDKRLAIRHKRRIPERTLLGLSALGGSVGGLLGMGVFHHKTKHKAFYIGIPVMLVLHMAAGFVWLLLQRN